VEGFSSQCVCVFLDGRLCNVGDLRLNSVLTVCCIDDFVGLGDWVLCCFDEYCVWNFSVWL
jgi:hypothetical protein